jgi:hypothetical protein
MQRGADTPVRRLLTLLFFGCRSLVRPVRPGTIPRRAPFSTRKFAVVRQIARSQRISQDPRGAVPLLTTLFLGYILYKAKPSDLRTCPR